MRRYLISFDHGAGTFLDEDLPDVAKAVLEVVEQAKDAGVWVRRRGEGPRGRASSPGRPGRLTWCTSTPAG
jgi:hypothetical protein